jgi:hypothetical protein
LSISDRTATNVLNDLESFFFVNRDIVGLETVTADIEQLNVFVLMAEFPYELQSQLETNRYYRKRDDSPTIYYLDTMERN